MTTVRPALDAALRKTIALRTEALYRAAAAVRDVHLALAGGRHLTIEIEPLRILGDPASTGELCAFLAEHGRGRDREPVVDVVAGAGPGGLVLAFETARQLGVRCVFDERSPSDLPSTGPLHHGFTIAPKERVLLVDEILGFGSAATSFLARIEEMGAEIVESVTLVDGTGASRAVLTSPATDRTYALRSLWQPDPAGHVAGAATCPACGAGTPLDERAANTGSDGATARQPVPVSDPAEPGPTTR